MREEDLFRIERGNPQSLGEVLLLLFMSLAVLGLLGFIIFGVIW